VLVETLVLATVAPPYRRRATAYVLRQMQGEVVVRARRLIPALLASGLVSGVLLWLAFHQGGFFEDERLTAAVVLWVGLGVVCLVELPRLRPSTPALVALAALALLTGWTALSTGWSADPVRGERMVDLDMIYLAILGIGILGAGAGRYARGMLLVAAGVCVVVAGAGLWARLHPGAFGSPLPDVAIDGYRMEWPLGYWNAMGGLAAMGGVLSLGLAGDPSSRFAVRISACAASVLCLVAAYVTFSRGSVAAVFLGVAVLVALGAHRASLTASVAVVAVAVGALVLRFEAVPALTTDPTAGNGQAQAGTAMTPVVVAVLALAAAAQGVLAVGDRSVALTSLVQRARRPALILVTGVALVGAFGAYVVRADAIEGRVASALTDTNDWLDRQWDEFNRPGAPRDAGRGSARLDTAAGTRSDLWAVARHAFADAPLRGQGAGSYQVLFFRDRTVDENVQNAHSLELETAAELGLIGAVLLLAFLGAVGAAVVRSRRHRLALPTTQTAAAGAAVTVWLVHASVDWDWQMPAFTGTALLIAVTLFPSGRRRRRSGRGPAVSGSG